MNFFESAMAIREAHDKLKGENDHLRAEVERLKQWQRDMIDKVAEESIDGYRELGDKLAKACETIDHLRAENGVLRPDAELYRWLKRQASSYNYDERDTTLDDILSNYSERWDELIYDAIERGYK